MPLRGLAPFDQPKTRAVLEGDLDPGDAERMNAGTGVVVASIGLILDLDAVGLDLRFQVAPLRQRQVLEHRPVGVAGDDGGDALIVAACPFVEPFVHFVAQAGIEGGAGRVLNAAALQIGPEVVHEEFAEGRDRPATLRVSLVAVQEQDGIVYDDPLMDLDAGEQRAIDCFVILPVQVVVPPHLEVAGLPRIRIVEFRQELIDRGVGDVDLVEIFVLPEILGVAQLDVGEAVFEVVFQGATIDQGILREVIRPGAVPPVHVGHDDQLHAGSEFDMPDAFKFGKAAHAF